ncbi:MAG: pyruvate kinase [Planctomycetota bacterium]
MSISRVFDDHSLRNRRRTKIVGTLGPASSSPEIIRALISQGMNCARINGSHGDHEAHSRTIACVRRMAAEVGRPVAVLFDLQGPKIRTLPGPGLPRQVSKDEVLEFVPGRSTSSNEIGVDHQNLDQDVRAGDPLLIDDGSVATEVLSVERGKVRCLVKNDGVIEARKGVNLPASHVTAPALTEKDRDDARFAIAQHVDAIALSFVRRASDVAELKALIRELDPNSDIRVISKIEKPQALEDLRGILDESWGVMVARGDLGVELSPEEVPTIQKRIIREANRLGKPVITATQMLESMTRNPRPTRAEASDVANAVLDGTDAVMLSQETAVGRFPVESVEMMVRILRTTEYYNRPPITTRRADRDTLSTPEAVADAACQVAHDLQAHAIVAFTRSGHTALLTAQRRPPRQIVVFTTNQRLSNLLALAWGVRSYLIEPVGNTDALLARLDEEMLKDGLAQPGDCMVLLMGAPAHRMGPPNMMMVHNVGEWTGLE